MKRVSLVVAFCMLVAGFAPASSAAEASLFERIGGGPVMTRVVDQMLHTLADDPAVNRPFDGVDLDKLSHKLYVHMCAATGGNCVYLGEDMRTVHAGLHISPGQVDASVAALVAALNANGVGQREQDELVHLIAPLGPEIVSP